ncbi:MAG: hypothetical protein RRC07_03220 [Anaerolineae bacterium]|nr:hypothetical protein [Anaerolineae bacterium]
MNDGTRTRLALLGTMSDLHGEPVAYDLARLSAIIAGVATDLLCAEITLEQWEGDDLSSAAFEVREALAPVVSATGVVPIPVAPSPLRFDDFGPARGRRAALVRSFDRLLRWGQRRANTPEAVNGPFFGGFCHTVCYVSERARTAAERAAWREQNVAIATNIIETVRRDPCRRVLVAVQCQRRHRLLPLLRRYDELLEIVGFDRL